MKNPNPDSNRSRKRHNRGFKSLEQSCRKHRRATKRLTIACTILGRLHKPGDDVQVTGKTTHKAGGSVRFH